MAPNMVSSSAGVLFEEDQTVRPQLPMTDSQSSAKRKTKGSIIWRNALMFLYLHGAALYGFYLMLTSAKLLTTAYAYLLYVIGGLGITAGAHRLWSHKAYKAKLPLRIMLMLFNTLAFQNSVYEWARDHRVHHKFTETDADPHNAKRGIFFSHIGWLLVKKHPDVLRKGKTVDMSDLLQDPVIRFQKKYYLWMMPFICFLVPTLVPVYLWGETWTNSWFVATLLRYCFTLNVTWLVNSVAHFFGTKPYDQNMNPAEAMCVAIAALGEGWHNYHHVFPWDYKAAELGNYRFNFTTAFIDFMGKLGQAYDLKTVSPKIVAARAKRTGDGSWKASKEGKDELAARPQVEEHSHEGEVWGWDDKDLKDEDKEACVVINKKD